MKDEPLILKGFEPLRDFTPPHMVQIPLEEYRKYIEATIKGPTVEIPLEEYNRLKNVEVNHYSEIDNLRHMNQELAEEIRFREDVKTQIERAIDRALKGLNVTDSDTRERR